MHPHKTTQKRSVRLLSAKKWLASYNGKNIVRGYAKHYKTDLLCAIADLKILGVEVPAAYEEAIRRSFADRTRQNIKKKGLALNNDHLSDSDQDFCFIVGYTSGGAPYGTVGTNFNSTPARSRCPI